jgi:hypothetical protein
VECGSRRSRIATFICRFGVGEQKAKFDKLIPMGQLRSCVVSYPGQSGHQTFSAEVTAETLYEAAVLGLKALDVDQRFTHNITIDVRVKNPETTHSISGESLKRGLHGPAKSATDQALKSRLKG